MSLARVYMAFSPSSRASPVVNRTQSFLCAMYLRLPGGQQVYEGLPVTDSGDVGPALAVHPIAQSRAADAKDAMTG